MSVCENVTVDISTSAVYDRNFYKITVCGIDTGFTVCIFQTKAYRDERHVYFIGETCGDDRIRSNYIDMVPSDVAYEYELLPSVTIYTFNVNKIEEYIEEAKKHILNRFKYRRSDLDDIIAACEKDMKG